MALIVDIHPDIEGTAVGIAVTGTDVGFTRGECEGAKVMKLMWN